MAAPGAQPSDDPYATAKQAGKDPWGEHPPWCYNRGGLDVAAFEAGLVLMLTALGVEDAEHIVQHQGNCKIEPKESFAKNQFID